MMSTRSGVLTVPPSSSAPKQQLSSLRMRRTMNHTAGAAACSLPLLLLLSLLFSAQRGDAFLIVPSAIPSTTTRRQQQRVIPAPKACNPHEDTVHSSSFLLTATRNDGGSGDEPIFYNDFEGFDDDSEQDEDDTVAVDADALGDWRAVRQRLMQSSQATTSKSSSSPNAKLLEAQNPHLAAEYRKSVWPHETATVRAFRLGTPAAGGEKMRIW